MGQAKNRREAIAKGLPDPGSSHIMDKWKLRFFTIIKPRLRKNKIMADVNKTVTFTVTYQDDGNVSISQETPADLQTMLTI